MLKASVTSAGHFFVRVSTKIFVPTRAADYRARTLRWDVSPRRRNNMSSRLSFVLALCLGVFVFSQADADHHHKKNKDKDTGLTECTIQSPNSAMGCTAPQKLVCEKMKNGQKCCGCVGDKNAETQQPDQKTQQQTQQPADNKPSGGSYCSQPIDQSARPLAESTCLRLHDTGTLNCDLQASGQVICCCHWTR
jgi:hypothetical protein